MNLEEREKTHTKPSKFQLKRQCQGKVHVVRQMLQKII